MYRGAGHICNPVLAATSGLTRFRKGRRSPICSFRVQEEEGYSFVSPNIAAGSDPNMPKLTSKTIGDFTRGVFNFKTSSITI